MPVTMSNILWTYTTTDGKKHIVVSIGANTGDVKSIDLTKINGRARKQN